MISSIKAQASRRSMIIAGQTKALIGAIESEEYCVDILTQSLAIQQSLKSLNKLVLENHLKTHVKDGLSKAPNSEKDKILDELLKLYQINNVKGN